MHLGYYLFNLASLQCINTILSNPHMSPTHSIYAPLYIIFTRIITEYATLAVKNPLIYVETLLGNVSNAQVCRQLYTSYEASLTTTEDRASRPVQGSDQEVEQNSSSSEDFGDEMDSFEALPSAFTKTKTKPVKSVSKRASAVTWNAAQDTILLRLYRLYASDRSVYSSISQHDDFLEACGERTVKQIKQRIQVLQREEAEMTQPMESDDEKELRGEEEEEEEEGTAPGECSYPNRPHNLSCCLLPMMAETDAVAAVWEQSSPKRSLQVERSGLSDDDNEEEGDVFEQRSLQLLKLSQRMQKQYDGEVKSKGEDKRDQPGDYSTYCLDFCSCCTLCCCTYCIGKRTLKKRARPRQSRASISDDDSSDSALDEPQPSDPVQQQQGGEKKAKLSMAQMLESDEEDH